MYAIKDKVSKVTNVPFSQATDRDAIHGLRTVVNEKDENNQISQFPEDFELWHIGEYDEREMQLKPLADPIKLATASDLLNA
jgi:hypothetical protein